MWTMNDGQWSLKNGLSKVDCEYILMNEINWQERKFIENIV